MEHKMKVLENIPEADKEEEKFYQLTGLNKPDYKNIASFISESNKIFFVGIGGISMCGLAEMSARLGAQCFGSDQNPNQRTAYLEKELGIKVWKEHRAESIDEVRPDLVVFSRAVFDDNPERLRAAELGIPCIERAIFLGSLLRLYDQVINISGTNGKSTVAAMSALMLIEAGLDPSVHLGAELIDFKTTVREGHGKKLILSEACEFRRGFFHYSGNINIILNMVHDHIDSYHTPGDMIDAFARFAALQDPGSTLILPTYEAKLDSFLRKVEELQPGHLASLNILYFGREDQVTPDGRKPDYSYSDLQYDDLGNPSFHVRCADEDWGKLALRIPGEFNVQNALAAITVSHLAGADRDSVATALLQFKGAEGRFTRTGYYNGAQVIIDYAHHPSAIEVTIDAAKHLPARRLWICFQPLTHSRVRGFFDSFVEALRHEDLIMMSEIYDDRERDSSISSRDIVERINELGGNAEYYPSNAELEAKLRTLLKPGDVLLIMGVDLRNVGDNLTGRHDHMKEVKDF
jgi:UDP-N-acetylmuramate--alanine ligase